ncbi:DUF2971 domain-containing protein [Rathayibacter soli]|uniref:DUF2971 domain-containing protein n=1 Tax=Rathayibacter soli TaxID=3144168 RepID=UPI0027E3DE72|nr:DUF2971 domain-containing protein [Glaciibacter superstes]
MSNDRVIYHYTTAAGLQGIIEGGSIWMTDARHLNDSGELVHAARIMRERITAKIESIRPEVLDESSNEDPAGSRVSVLRGIQSYLDRIELGQDYGYSAYVTAFCEDGNLLSQWRGYGGGVLGYSLGFSRDVLEKSDSLAKPTMPGLYGAQQVSKPLELIPVDYGTDAGMAQIQDAIDQLAPYPSGHPGVHADVQFGQHVLPVLAKIKDPGFREEKEWRLLLTTDSWLKTVKVRVGPTGLVPYVEALWPREALKAIIVGPGPNLELRADAVRKFVHRNYDTDAHSIDVTTSRIPFRV